MRLRTSLLSLALIAGLGLGLNAQATEALNEVPASAPDAADVRAAEKADRLARFCPDATATRIKRNQGRCMTPGRVYTRSELFSTGETTVGAALSKLDPSLRGG